MRSWETWVLSWVSLFQPCDRGHTTQQTLSWEPPSLVPSIPWTVSEDSPLPSPETNNESPDQTAQFY